MGNTTNKNENLETNLNEVLLEKYRKTTNLSDEEIRCEHERFHELAENGRLKKIYIEELLGDHIPGNKWKHIKYLIDCIFVAADTNKDGSIDFLEYLMTRRFFQSSSAEEKAEFIFRIIDHNDDKIVSRKELEKMLECLEDFHRRSTNRVVHRLIENGVRPTANFIFEKLDEDKSGLVDRTEFIDGWLKDETIRELFTF